MVYRVNRDPIIDDNGVLRVDIIQTGNDIINQFQFGGTSFGYLSGGNASAGGTFNDIQRWPFASDANATDIGDLSRIASATSSQSSKTHAYTSGHYVSDVIDKYPFASAPVTATDVGDLTVQRAYAAGQSSLTHGYASGGSEGYSPPPPGYPLFNIIDKFPFSADANATDVGDITQARQTIGNSSSGHGYTSGGGDSVPNMSNVIDKFPFSADANATDVGDLTLARTAGGSQSSDTHGYVAGGYDPSTGPTTGANVIDKFSFAADGNATDVGDLTVQTGSSRAGSSSTVSGYTMGGNGGPPFGPTALRNNVIDKFSFSSDANATDVGDLTRDVRNSSGHQV